MEVALPNTGCNILRSDSSFYNYSPDSRTRSTFYIYDGVAHKESESYSQYGYSYTGTCLNTGDLIYKPELQIYYQFISFILVGFAFWLIWRLCIRRLLP